MSIAIIAGALANKAGNAGAAWTRLSWALGFRDLGFDVHMVEQLASPAIRNAGSWFADVTAALGMGGSSSLLGADGSCIHGLDRDELVELAAEAAVLVNISGHLVDEKIVGRVRNRVFIDLDPGYTQLWHHQGLAPLREHSHWFTVGCLVGTSACDLPTDGIPWRPVRQPVVLTEWPQQPPKSTGTYTTVASWRGGYGTVDHNGVSMGGKVHEFRRFLPVPRQVGRDFELALEIHGADAADLEALEHHGWRVVRPQDAVGTIGSFRQYVQSSFAEFSAAQRTYVEANTGWFSDRTTRYLASGRPAVVQETGFGRSLPTGEGLLSFRSVEEAADAAKEVANDPARHSRAARELAETFFASDRVIGDLCEEVGVAP